MECISELCFYGIEELSQEWQIHHMVVKRWMMSNKLRAHLWLPVQTVYKVVEQDSMKVSLHLAHFQGMISVTHKQCQRLFRTGALTIREFYCTTSQIRYKLPETSEVIQAEDNDLIGFYASSKDELINKSFSMLFKWDELSYHKDISMEEFEQMLDLQFLHIKNRKVIDLLGRK